MRPPTGRCMHRPAQRLGLPADSAGRHSNPDYWTMLTSVPNISSAVVIVRELAW
jgi:hypothetical protein